MGNKEEDIKVDKVIQDYRFTYDTEPSDEQLAMIMKEVADEAKQKAIETNSILMSNLSKQVRLAKQTHSMIKRHSHEPNQA